MLEAILIALVLAPDLMMQMTGHMLHSDPSKFHWTMTWAGFFSGLMACLFLAGIAGAMFIAIYNWLVGASKENT